MFTFKTKPFAKQLEALNKSVDATSFALHMEQGTGKTKVAIDTAAYHYQRGTIAGVVIVAPNGVQTGWIKDQIPDHLPDNIPRICAEWNRNRPKKIEVLFKPGIELRFLAINYEALATKAGQDLVNRFLSAYRCLLVCDESHRIKNHKAQASKFLHQIKGKAILRRTLTGTPAAESPLDLYSQFYFLNPSILGFGSFTAFKAHYAVLEPPTSNLVRGIMRKLVQKYGEAKAAKMAPQLVARDKDGFPRYRNVDQLTTTIHPHSFRCLRTECVDLPGKVYEKRYVELNRVQRATYESLRDNFLAEIEGGLVTAPLAMTRLVRMQQVVGGFLPDEEGRLHPLGDSNPKLQALLDIAEDFPGKLIIWARFTAELDLISDALEEAHGPHSVARYWGDIDKDHRAENKRRFIEDASCRFWVAQPRAGGTGVDGLQHAAHTVVYFSNEFSLTSRLQSEDRADRIGQDKTVVIIDLEAEDTLDQKVITALRAKKNVADQITGDHIKEWI